MNESAHDPASVLSAEDLAAARAEAEAAPPFTGRTRDILSNIFGPTLREMYQEATAAA